jgi:hypothetical protein
LLRNCFLIHFIGEKIGGSEEEEEDVNSYWVKKIRIINVKEEALDRTVWRTGFGRGYGPVVRQAV